MGIWESLESDIASIVQIDGEQIKITTATQTCYVSAFWTAESLDGGEQGGPYMWIAVEDMPDDLRTGNTATYDGISYRIEHRADDGHGLQRLTLVR